MTRKDGAYVLVGIAPGDFPTPPFDVVTNCWRVVLDFAG